MNKIYCAVYELVKAHFEGNEDDFKRNLKAIADYCEKEGNIKGADELRMYLDAVVKLDNRTTRKYFKENPDGTQTEISKEEYDRLVNPNPLDKPVIEPVNIEKPVFKQPFSIEPDKESVQEQAAFKEKSAAEENTTDEEKSENEPKKRHRRIKAEMEEYRNSDEYKQKQNQPKRHRRTKAEMEAERNKQNDYEQLSLL